MRIFIAVWSFLRGWGGLTLGGIYTAALGLDKLVKTVDELIFRFWDYPVFEVIDYPKPPSGNNQLIRTHIGQIIGNPVPDFRLLIPGYSVEEIAKHLGRGQKSVFKSLKRLKRMGKAVERLEGWFSKDNAPQTPNS